MVGNLIQFNILFPVLQIFCNKNKNAILIFVPVVYLVYHSKLIALTCAVVVLFCFVPNGDFIAPFISFLIDLILIPRKD